MTSINLKSTNAPPPPELLVGPENKGFLGALHAYVVDLTSYLNRYILQSTNDLRKISGETLDAGALALIADIFDDEKITPVDKLTSYRLWLNIVAEATLTTGTIPIQAAVYSVDDSAFDTAFAALDTYLNTTISVFDDMEASTTITRTVWDAAWNAYENQKTLLNNAITTAASDAHREITVRADGNLDDSFPLEFDWKIPADITTITSVYLSFKIKPFRANSTAAASGGSSTPTSSGTTTGWRQTTTGSVSVAKDTGNPTSNPNSDNPASGTTGNRNGATTPTAYADALGEFTDYEDGTGSHRHGQNEISGSGHRHAIGDVSHNHAVGNHGHALPDHAHPQTDHAHDINLDDHTHTVAISAHTHPLTYGIYEEDNAPISITYQISDGGAYGASSSAYTSDQSNIDITSSLSGTGWKGIKFLSDKRAGIVSVIEFQGATV